MKKNNEENEKAGANLLGSFRQQKNLLTEQLEKRKRAIDKYLLLSWLKKNNFSLFSQLVLDNPKNFLPLIYTPTIGEICLNYSSLAGFLPQEGLIINLNDLPKLDKIFVDYQKKFGKPQIAILTDGSRILGLGDLGINGFPIC